jgi:hypothetical protein
VGSGLESKRGWGLFLSMFVSHSLRYIMSSRVIAFTIAYILKILHSSDPSSSSKAALAAIKKAEPSEMTHFDPELVSPLSPFDI